MSMSDSALLDEFSDALWLEDGLSRNTLESYRRDLKQFQAWLEKLHGRDLLAASHADLLSYLAHKVAAKAKATSTSRLLSSLKRFYQYALRQNKIRRTWKIAEERQRYWNCFGFKTKVWLLFGDGGGLGVAVGHTLAVRMRQGGPMGDETEKWLLEERVGFGLGRAEKLSKKPEQGGNENSCLKFEPQNGSIFAGQSMTRCVCC